MKISGFFLTESKEKRHEIINSIIQQLNNISLKELKAISGIVSVIMDRR